jgi:hypothetical protein
MRLHPRSAALAATALVAAALVATPAAGANARDRVQLGAFAGYVWVHAPVTEVSATFTVPRIGRGSPPTATAGTWVGAQAPGVDGPFIQIGVNEVRLAAPLRDGTRDYYFAFWTDTRRHYHPVPLFPVRPGDRVAASLRRLRVGWRLALVDVTDGRARRFVTADESRGGFNVAEWLQEDVTDSRAREPYPYPRLTGGRFEALLVDSRAPRGPNLMSQWMSTQRGDIAPTPPSDDSFTLRRGRLGVLAARFWRLAAGDDAAASAFDQVEQRWASATPGSQVAADSSAFAAAIRANIRLLAQPPWPPRLRAFARALIGSQLALLRLVESAPGRVPRGLAAWRTAFRRDGRAVADAGFELRSRLHGPDLIG